MIGMQLPQHIIDLVGNLFDEGMDDATICRAVIKAWEKHMESPRRKAFGNDEPAGTSVCSPARIGETYTSPNS